MAASKWLKFPCSKRQLRLDVVLRCGQSFRWAQSGNGEWLGALDGHVWRLKQDETHIYFQAYGGELDGDTADLKTVTHNNNTEVFDNSSLYFPDDKSCISLKKKVEITDQRSKCRGQRSQSGTGKLKTITTLIKTEITGADTDSQLSVPLCVKHEPIDAQLNKLSNVKHEPGEAKMKDKLVSTLQDYFQLNTNVDNLYQQWSKADPYFRKMAADFWGIRILRQDPVECLFSFICSSNNHITRISGMVEKLCIHYGRLIADVDGKLYYSFPAVAVLATPGVEEKLRELGFGYRAKFIAQSARYIMDNNGEHWVHSLRLASYQEAKAELMKLHGVGAKVADCVCLMSLDKPGAIPVDTHVWQFAAKHYLPKLKAAKSVTDNLYQEIGDYFRNLWGEYAGWAQSVLFTSELRQMQSMKSSSDQKDMEKAAVDPSTKRKKKSVEESQPATPKVPRKSCRKK